MTATWEEPVVRHRVVPFDTLSEREAAEHMVACHGFDEDYFAASDPQGWGMGRDPDREEALRYWETHPDVAADEHLNEHHVGQFAEYGGLGGGIPHTHTKPLNAVGDEAAR